LKKILSIRDFLSIVEINESQAALDQANKIDAASNPTLAS
jgi:hypothetical protein